MKTIEHPLRKRAFARQLTELGQLAEGPLLSLVTQRLEEVRRLTAQRQENKRALVADPTRATAMVVEQLSLPVKRAEVRRAIALGWVDGALLDERLAGQVAVADLDASLALELAALNATTLDALGAQLALLLGAVREGLAAPLSGRAAARAITGLAGRWPSPTLELLKSVLSHPLPRDRALGAVLLEARWALDRGDCVADWSHLLEAARGPDDFLIRQQIVVLMTRHGPADPGLLTLALRDPSEHVRLAVARAALTLSADLRLKFLSGLAVDPSARVRASCADALGRLVPSAAEVSLLATLRADRAAVVARVAEEELAGWVERRALGPQQLKGDAPAPRDWAGLEARARLVALGDEGFVALNEQAGSALAALSEGERCTVQVAADAESFGRLLSFHARDGFGLYATAVKGGYRVWRGARFARRLWRLGHELSKPSPYKRQDQLHSVGRVFEGELRAHSPLLAESTPTIPGEPVEANTVVGWGSFLPTVDDLLSVGVVSPRPVVLFTAAGSTTVTAPSTFAARVKAQLFLGRHYARLAELRRSALSPSDPKVAQRYVSQLRALGFAVQHRAPSGAGELPAGILQPFGAAMMMLPFHDGVNDLLSYLLSPTDNSLPELGVAVGALGLGLLASNLVRREQIRAARRQVPLVIGGWGTRGKSGTERLKAAMLGAQGVSLLAKTTGCEAMFIHQAPGVAPCEIFIHRSYDKATIWEQRDLIELAGALRSDAFLWECMALSPPLVRVLQRDWMRDDYSTLTNAYPDHEDIQGPAGHDVARVISQFIRPGGVVLTSEEQMLPLLRAEARVVGARLTEVGSRDELFIGEDLLARFPYQEHPRNIALVRRLAAELGLDPDLATADMADHIVPDLGVLKTYPTSNHRGRALTFVNGMSANERTGFLSNWRRTGFDAARTESAQWVVTVVNNRQDRVARSTVFADILVRDAAADRHVLIGTNLSGLRGYVRESLERWLDENPLVRPEDREVELGALALERVAAMARQLRVGACTAEAIGSELVALGVAIDRAVLEAWIGVVRAQVERHAVAGEFQALTLALTRGRAAAAPALALVNEEARQFAARSVARRALIHALAHRCGQGATAEARQRLVALQRQLHVELLEEMIVSVEDSGSSGDQVIDQLALACPPGAEVRVMGIQNIKGTGLDFVYRFVRLDEVAVLLRRIEEAGADEAIELCAQLSARVDYGMLDAAMAAAALGELAQRGEGDVEEAAGRLGARLGALAADKRVAAGLRQSANKSGWRRLVGRALDPLDAIRRRRRADEVIRALAAGLISHPRAAAEMRAIGAREKGGWLREG